MAWRAETAMTEERRRALARRDRPSKELHDEKKGQEGRSKGPEKREV